MDVRDKVRERRQERMKQIARQQGWMPPPGRAEYAPDARGGEHPAQPSRMPSAREPSRPMPIDPRLQDPEYVWKHRDSLRASSSRPGGWSDFSGASGAGPFGGAADSVPSGRGGSRMFQPPSSSTLWRNLILSAIVFAAVWGLFRVPYPWAEQGKTYVTDAMTEDFNFAAVQAWYTAAFNGSPSLLPVFHGKSEREARKASSTVSDQYLPPVAGKIVVPYTSAQSGVTLETSPSEEVKAIDDGRVMMVNATTDQGYVVMIQHAQGMQTVYGGVADTMVKKNDWVQRGQAIGHTANRSGQTKATLYFSMKKEDQYINPADVIPFD